MLPRRIRSRRSGSASSSAMRSTMSGSSQGALHHHLGPVEEGEIAATPRRVADHDGAGGGTFVEAPRDLVVHRMRLVRAGPAREVVATSLQQAGQLEAVLRRVDHRERDLAAGVDDAGRGSDGVVVVEEIPGTRRGHQSRVGHLGAAADAQDVDAARGWVGVGAKRRHVHREREIRRWTSADALDRLDRVRADVDAVEGRERLHQVARQVRFERLAHDAGRIAAALPPVADRVDGEHLVGVVEDGQEHVVRLFQPEPARARRHAQRERRRARHGVQGPVGSPLELQALQVEGLHAVGAGRLDQHVFELVLEAVADQARHSPHRQHQHVCARPGDELQRRRAERPLRDQPHSGEPLRRSAPPAGGGRSGARRRPPGGAASAAECSRP